MKMNDVEQWHDKVARIISQSTSADELGTKFQEAFSIPTPYDSDDYYAFLFFVFAHGKDVAIKYKAFKEYLIDDFKKCERIDLLLALAFRFEGADDVVWFDKQKQKLDNNNELKKLYAKAQPNIPLLITGETGTGKEAMARVIHTLSPRRNNPFVALNCAAIPETHIESELFGYMKGAFTGAISNKPGLIEEANGGTLFLDEIGRSSRDFQNKILRFLQDGSYRRLGEYKKGKPAGNKADVRILAAIQDNRIEQNDIESDLLYRLGYPIPIKVHPLRVKLKEMPRMIVDNILRKVAIELKINKEVYQSGFSNPPSLLASTYSKADKITMHNGCYKLIMSYDWPGNYRELQSVLRDALINAQCDGRDELWPTDFWDELTQNAIRQLDEKEPLQNKSALNYENIKLKDIFTHAKEQAKKYEAKIVNAKVNDIMKGGKVNFRSILLKEGLRENEYPAFTKKIRELTGKSISIRKVAVPCRQ